MSDVIGVFPSFLRDQIAALHRQETQARLGAQALLRIYFAGAGHDLDALAQVEPIDLTTGAYRYRVIPASSAPGD